MTKQIKFLAILLFVGMFIACDDARDIDQDGTPTDDEIFETVEDLEKGLNGAYQAYTTFDQINFNAIFSDNAKNGKSSNGQNASLYAYNLTTTTDEAEGIWVGHYQLINRANRVLEAYEDLDLSADEQAEADEIAGQLYALRALGHMELYMYYAEAYNQDDKLAVPIMTHVEDNLDYQPSRNTVGEVVDFVREDLHEAKQLLDGADLSVKYIDAAGAQGLEARLELFRENWNTADSLATELYTEYGVTSMDNYLDMHADQSDDGVIFKRTYVDRTDEIAGIFYFNNVDIDGDPYVEVSNDLFNILDPDDIRFKSIVVDPDDDAGSEVVGENDIDNVLLINKYPGSSRGPMTNDYKALRGAEMLLIAAEAQARQGDVGTAEQTIQELLDERYPSGDAPTVSYADDNEALKDILEQRRIELAFEGHRFLDIKRFRDITNQGIDRNEMDCISYSVEDCNLSKDDYRFTMPIPQVELNANGEIEQNPNY